LESAAETADKSFPLAAATSVERDSNACA